MYSALEELRNRGIAAKNASQRLAFLSTEIKNRALNGIAAGLLARKDEILAANKKDYDAGKASGMGEALLDRLFLDERRLEGIAAATR